MNSIKNQTLFKESRFVGSTLSLIGLSAMLVFVIIFTIGLGYPWAVCEKEYWLAKNTRIDGKRLKFDGKSLEHFGMCIKWFLLTIITLGIFALCIPVKRKNWVIEHTHLV